MKSRRTTSAYVLTAWAPGGTKTAVPMAADVSGRTQHIFGTNMEFRYAEEADAPFLADINRQLIEDEWDGGGMSLQRLEERMLRWIREDDYTAVLFLEEGATVAYSMVSVDDDSAYIRHFFVLKEHRGKGVGRRAIQVLLSQVIPPYARVTLDVLSSNHTGHGFWQSQGFRDYAIRMELLPREPADGAESPAAG